MRFRHALLIALLGLGAGFALLAQRPFKEWDAIEYNHNIPIPSDFDTKTDWVRARLRYPDIYGYPFKQLYYQGREFPGYWTMDYPRSDRHLLEGVKRLRSVPVTLSMP